MSRGEIVSTSEHATRVRVEIARGATVAAFFVIGLGRLMVGGPGNAGLCGHDLLAAQANLIIGSGFMARNVVRGYLPTSCAYGVCSGLGRVSIYRIERKHRIGSAILSNTSAARHIFRSRTAR